jgi:hypothetical protein
MSGDKGLLGGGGAGAILKAAEGDEVVYPTHMQIPHSLWLTGYTASEIAALTGDDLDELKAKIPAVVDDIALARSTAGNPSPLSGLTSPEVVQYLDDLDERREVFLEALGEYDQEEVTDIYSRAQEIASEFATTNDIDVESFMESFERRTKNAFLRNVSRAAAGMWDTRAVLNTQFGMMMANMESDRQIEVNDMEARLRLLQAQERANQTVQVARDFMNNHEFRINAYNAAIGNEMDVAKFKIITEQDKAEWDVEMATRDRLWNLELYAYGGNVLAGITGAATMPRAMTGREKILGAFTSSSAFGINVGVTTRSPQAGMAAGLISFAAQLWAYGGK